MSGVRGGRSRSISGAFCGGLVRGREVPAMLGLGLARPMAPSRLGPSRRRHSMTASKLVAVEDRKSTRLNSSHASISYAVFCLKKKNTKQLEVDRLHFHAAVQGSTLTFILGFYIPTFFAIPQKINITMTDITKITIYCIAKTSV